MITTIVQKNINKLALFVAAFLLLGLPQAMAKGKAPESVSGATTIDTAKAVELHGAGVKFIDVRNGKDYKKAHIPGAVHLDLKKGFSKDNLAEVADTGEKIVIYCVGPNCKRSSSACKKAVKWGYSSVHYYRDGMFGWRSGGNRVEK